MRNPPRSVSSRIGHRWMPDASRESVSRSPDDSNSAYQVPPIRSEASSVPRARSQSTTPRSVLTASTRPSWRIDACPKMTRIAGRMGQGPVFEGRIDLVRRQGVLVDDDDPAVPAEFRSGEDPSAVRLRTGRPRIGSQSRSRSSHPLLARSVPEGWNAARQPDVGRAFEDDLPPAGGGIPEVDLRIIARRRQGGPVRAPGDPGPRRRQRDRFVRPGGRSPIPRSDT